MDNTSTQPDDWAMPSTAELANYGCDFMLGTSKHGDSIDYVSVKLGFYSDGGEDDDKAIADIVSLAIKLVMLHYGEAPCVISSEQTDSIHLLSPSQFGRGAGAWVLKAELEMGDGAGDHKWETY